MIGSTGFKKLAPLSLPRNGVTGLPDMEEWRERQSSQHAHQSAMFERRQRAQAEQKEKDRAAAAEREGQRQRSQLEVIERKNELARLQQELGVQGEALLELMRHRLEPEQLERLTEDYAKRKSIDTQALQKELELETHSKTRLIESEGDDERRTLKAKLKSRLTELLVEHRLRAAEMRLSHDLSKDIASHEAKLRPQGIAPEEAAEIDEFIRERLSGKAT